MNRTEALRGAAIEALELRRLLSVTIDSAGVVRGVGTSGADVLRIEQPSETAIRVTVNAQTATFDTEDVTAILLQGLGGNDAFEERLFPDSTIPVTHEGGDGNDDFDVYRTNTVRGGAGNDQVDVILPDGNIPAEYDGGSGVDGISIGLNHFLDLNRFPTVENASAESGELIGNALNNGLTLQEGGVLHGNAGNDSLFFSRFGGRMFGGDGNDTLRVGDAEDADPVTLVGGAGNDLLVGGEDDDTLNGEAGNDTLNGDLGGDLLQGGTGLDTLDYSSRTANLGITIDNVANDGTRGASGPPTEGDNAFTDIETVLAGSGDDYIFGDGLNNLFRGNAGNDFLGGFGGHDALYGGSGHDRLEGGNGNDYLEGSSGNDALVGGSGTDYFVAGDGDDWLYSRDGIVEHADGGGGFDRAQRDSNDSVFNVESFIA